MGILLKIVKTEFLKIKRYHIMLIGIIGMACSPLLQLFSQAVMAEEYKTPDYDFPALVRATVWGNATIFMPVIFTLIGGYLINREYTDDTLKNILTVPVSYRRFLTGKLAAAGLLAGILGIYSFGVTTAVGICAGLSWINGSALLNGLLQMTALSFCIYIVILPVLALCSRKAGLFMGGAVVSFLSGYCCMFFKEGLLRSIYPFSAALTVIGFDMSDFAGTLDEGNVFLGSIVLVGMLLVAALLVCFSGEPGNVQKIKKGKKKGRRRRS